MKNIHLKKENNELAGLSLLIGLIQVCIGIIFLIPPILGAIFFTLNLFGMNGDIVCLYKLSYCWTGGESATPAAPIYLGLMALAGSFLLHSAVKNFIYAEYVDEGINSISDIEIEEKEKSESPE